MDSCGELAGHLGDRSLDLSYELEEGCHGSEGDGARCYACDSPREGDDVAGREAELDYAAREEVVVVAGDGLSLEVVLVVSEGVDRMAGVLK